MAQTRAFSLGGIGSPCCCSQAGCTITIDTKWCQTCLIPGTITVVAHDTTSTGPVIATATASPTTGRAVFKIPSSAPSVIWFTATTTASGYINSPGRQTDIFTSDGQPCNPNLWFSALSPPSFSVTISDLGSTTVTGNVDGYTGTLSGYALNLFICNTPASANLVLRANNPSIPDSRQYDLLGTSPHFTPCVPVSVTGTLGATTASVTQ